MSVTGDETVDGASQQKKRYHPRSIRRLFFSRTNAGDPSVDGVREREENCQGGNLKADVRSYVSG